MKASKTKKTFIQIYVQITIPPPCISLWSTDWSWSSHLARKLSLDLSMTNKTNTSCSWKSGPGKAAKYLRSWVDWCKRKQYIQYFYSSPGKNAETPKRICSPGCLVQHMSTVSWFASDDFKLMADL